MDTTGAESGRGAGVTAAVLTGSSLGGASTEADAGAAAGAGSAAVAGAVAGTGSAGVTVTAAEAICSDGVPAGSACWADGDVSTGSVTGVPVDDASPEASCTISAAVVVAAASSDDVTAGADVSAAGAASVFDVSGTTGAEVCHGRRSGIGFRFGRFGRIRYRGRLCLIFRIINQGR